MDADWLEDAEEKAGVVSAPVCRTKGQQRVHVQVVPFVEVEDAEEGMQTLASFFRGHTRSSMPQSFRIQAAFFVRHRVSSEGKCSEECRGHVNSRVRSADRAHPARQLRKLANEQNGLHLRCP